MRAMILAAGRGARMRELTEDRPKPLLQAGGKPLIEWQIQRLAEAGFHDLVVNTGWHGKRLREALGNGERLGVTVRYSDEGWPALETAGGIRRALPLLGSDPFLVVNADLWCDYDLARLRGLDPEGHAHLVLVDNPPHHASGDFGLIDGRLDRQARPRFTYSGIGVFRPAMFEPLADGERPLRPVLEAAIEAGAVSGEHHGGRWMDIGSPDRLAALDAALRADGA
ncbi:nucleotidyltransferase family protein [Wenzhouxiangella sp. XN79A]|uniref:N-acetylmuramate alpha-1-phosphate uridylyltransferase MurU n=1 Tax=Wenzhouxiangella sp. XN79A TaxID=2724193 RepID=UPI00144AE916|nr:nucleotidyltransferase family protein [Wenzhouxiangella sp. XN79A]NKI34658.1 nucleotidyltransferase family protein [Wenzhouxiangella sp. XN79A]